MLKLIPVDESHIEWLRVQRNRPELYRYFRQDKPITEGQQKMWWKTLDRKMSALFVLRNEKSDKVGYAGFNPMNKYALRGEFGLFVVPEHQGKGYATDGLWQLLDNGFNEFGLRTIYSDCLEYPGEDRFGFYARFGFQKYPDSCQGVRYKKQGQWVASTRFYMTKEMYDSSRKSRLGPRITETVARVIRKAGRPKGSGLHSGKDRLKAVSK